MSAARWGVADDFCLTVKHWGGAALSPHPHRQWRCMGGGVIIGECQRKMADEKNPEMSGRPLVAEAGTLLLVTLLIL